MIFAGVYRIVDAVNGRFYIGSSINIAKRWRQHCYRLSRGNHPNSVLQNIWNADATRLSVAIVSAVEPPNRDAILAAEQAALDAAQVGINRLCINVLAIAGSHLGRKRSDATRLALSLANRGKKATEEAKVKMRAAKLGKKQTDQHRRNSGLARLGIKINRPPGMFRYSQRFLSRHQVLDLRAKRAAGLSWRSLAMLVSMNASAVKRAVLGVTYRDIVA